MFKIAALLSIMAPRGCRAGGDAVSPRLRRLAAVILSTSYLWRIKAITNRVRWQAITCLRSYWLDVQLVVNDRIGSNAASGFWSWSFCAAPAAACGNARDLL